MTARTRHRTDYGPGLIFAAAEAAGVEREPGSGDEKWTIRCIDPAEHRNGDAKPSAVIFGDSNRFYCNGCGLSLSFRGFCSRVGLSLKETQALAAAGHVGTSFSQSKSASANEAEAVWRSLARKNTAGEKYLSQRGLGDATKRCRFATSSSPGKAGKFAKQGFKLVVPLRDRSGHIVALQFRQLYDSTDTHRTLGPSNAGMFGHPERLATAVTLVVAEGLTDYLAASIALEGDSRFCVVGVAGVNATKCLRTLDLNGKRVVAAHDADKAGDDGAKRVAEIATSLGADCYRARPKNRQKDLCGIDDPLQVAKLIERASLLVSATGSWDEPIPLHDFNRPAFPVKELPSWMASFVAAEAEATQTPPDLAAVVMLAVVATTVARRFEVAARDDWPEPLNIYTVVCQPPGARKSAVFRDVVSPLAEFESRSATEMKDLIVEAQAKKRMLQRTLDAAERGVVKAKTPAKRAQAEQRVIELSKELASLKSVVAVQLKTQDVTPERLVGLLAEQGGRMAMLSPEGGLFDLMAGKYTKNVPHFEIYLHGHPGDDYKVDRVGRPAEFVKSPAITLGLTVQPQVIAGLANTPAFRQRGLIARFLFAMPQDVIGHREVAPKPVPRLIRDEYRKKVGELLALPGADPDDDGHTPPRRIRFSSSAQIALAKFMQWLEPRMREFRSLGSLQDWAAKLAGAVVRISGLLHVAEMAGTDPCSRSIDAKTVSRAIKIGHYFVAHAKIAFAEMGADELTGKAGYVLRWIRSSRRESFSRKQAFDKLRGTFRVVTNLEPALDLLEAHGFVRKRPSDAVGPGRRTALYDVNPKVYPHNPHNPRKSKRGGSP